MTDIKAAVSLLKEVYSAKFIDIRQGLDGGLVFEIDGDISPEDQQVLGIIPFS